MADSRRILGDAPDEDALGDTPFLEYIHSAAASRPVQPPQTKGRLGRLFRNQEPSPFGDAHPELISGPLLPQGSLHLQEVALPERAIGKSVALPESNAVSSQSIGVVPALFTKGVPLRIVIGGFQGGAGRTTLGLELATAAASLGVQGGVGVVLWEATGRTALKHILRLPVPSSGSDARLVASCRTPASWGQPTLVLGPDRVALDCDLEESIALDRYLTRYHHVVIAELSSSSLEGVSLQADRARHLAHGAHAILVPLTLIPGSVAAAQAYVDELLALGLAAASIWLAVREVPGQDRGVSDDMAHLTDAVGHVIQVPHRPDAIVTALARGVPAVLSDAPLREAMSSLFMEILQAYRVAAHTPQPRLPEATASTAGATNPLLMRLAVGPDDAQ
ncbi:MAG: hypothetical protein ACYCZN_02145 [Candidatus Dormibacteria bacterium]